jgi:hypothetical protein
LRIRVPTGAWFVAPTSSMSLYLFASP